MPSSFVHKIFAFLEARPVIGGLEISDTALRFMSSGSAEIASVRLAPGIMVGGRVEDQAAFSEALRLLRSEVLGPKARNTARINVVVTLSSVHVYSQVFALPYLEGENLEKAVDLNLKMALPGGADHSHAGWQILNANGASGRIEIFSAFLDKNIADDLTAILRKENFSVFAIESKAISLARMVRRSVGFDPKVPSVVFAADTEGLDVMIVHGGNLQFDYFSSWKDLQADQKEITIEAFEGYVLRSVNQILNFYNAHWKEPITGILVAATGMKDEIVKTISGNFGVQVKELALPFSPPITPEWFAAFGAALRGRMPRKDDREISLLGVDAQEEYREEQVDHFLGFWRLLAPMSLSVLAIILVVVFLFLKNIHGGLLAAPALRLNPDQAREIASFKEQAALFNSNVALLKAAGAYSVPKTAALGRIFEMLTRHNIVLNRLSIEKPGEPIVLSGSASSENAIPELKNELILTPGIKDVTLPVTAIKKEGDIYTFSLTFRANF